MRRYVLDALNRAGPYGLGTTDASVVIFLDHVPVPTFGNLPNHRADETMFGQQVAIRFGGVLRTTIRVVDAALRRPSFSDSRLQCRNSNAGLDRATNRVADDTA